MKPMLQIAIVGCGAIFENHVAALESCPHVELAALCDSDPSIAAAMKNKFSVPFFTSFSEMLSMKTLDAVHLCVPHWLHAPMAIEALQAGLHVLSEKPAALNMSQVAEMQSAQQKANKQVGICLQNRYNSSSQYIKEIVTQGGLGPVIGGRGHVFWHRDAAYYQNGPWRGKWATEGGGVLINQAIHTLDLLTWFINQPVMSLRGSASTKYLWQTIEVEDTADILLEFENGTRGIFYATNGHVDNAPVEVEILCQKGRIHLIGDTVKVTGEGIDCIQDFSAGDILGKDYWGKGHKALIADFYDCLSENRQFPIDLQEGSKCLALVKGVYKSQQTGDAVPIQYL